MLRSNLSSTRCYKGVKITRLLSLISIGAIWAVVIRVTDIRFVEKDLSLSLQ